MHRSSRLGHKRVSADLIARLASSTLAAVDACCELVDKFGDVATLKGRVYLEKIQVPSLPCRAAVQIDGRQCLCLCLCACACASATVAMVADVVF